MQIAARWHASRCHNHVARVQAGLSPHRIIAAPARQSGKFEVTFDSVSVSGRAIALTGKHRQKGRGNNVGALLGSMVISGRSAVMLPGDLVNVFTGQDFIYY
jgi:hypothetical protein